MKVALGGEGKGTNTAVYLQQPLPVTENTSGSSCTKVREIRTYNSTRKTNTTNNHKKKDDYTGREVECRVLRVNVRCVSGLLHSIAGKVQNTRRGKREGGRVFRLWLRKCDLFAVWKKINRKDRNDSMTVFTTTTTSTTTVNTRSNTGSSTSARKHTTTTAAAKKQRQRQRQQ